MLTLSLSLPLLSAVRLLYAVCGVAGASYCSCLWLLVATLHKPTPRPIVAPICFLIPAFIRTLSLGFDIRKFEHFLPNLRIFFQHSFSPHPKKIRFLRDQACVWCAIYHATITVGLANQKFCFDFFAKSFFVSEIFFKKFIQFWR